MLGTIFMGLATPTEAGAMGVVGAIALAAFYGTLTWPLLYQGMATTMRITAMVVYILIGARVFSLVFQGVGGKDWIEHLLIVAAGRAESAFWSSPTHSSSWSHSSSISSRSPSSSSRCWRRSPTSSASTSIWFGVLICANIQTSFMHPPFGFALFYLRGIAPPSIKTSDIYWGAIPWVFLQVILVIVVIFWPGSVTYWIDKGPVIDPGKIEIPPPQFGSSGLNIPAPNFGPTLPTTAPICGGTQKAPDATPVEPAKLKRQSGRSAGRPAEGGTAKGGAAKGG